jgi:hypothetical protein
MYPGLKTVAELHSLLFGCGYWQEEVITVVLRLWTFLVQIAGSLRKPLLGE